jgi:hypothetical protein
MAKRRADDCDFHSGFRRRKREDRKKRQLYILLAAAAVAIMVCGGVGAVVLSGLKHVARAARNSGEGDPPDEAGPPVAKLSALELYRAYDRDEARADDRYFERSVAVEGTIANVDQLPGLGWRVALSTGPNHARVHAWFAHNQRATGRLAVGQKCAIIGQCCGKGPDPTGAGRWVVTLGACRVSE